MACETCILKSRDHWESCGERLRGWTNATYATMRGHLNIFIRMFNSNHLDE